jgi:hypothetical protein
MNDDEWMSMDKGNGWMLMDGRGQTDGTGQTEWRRTSNETTNKMEEQNGLQ